MAVFVILQLLLQMYEVDFKDWGQSPSDSVDKTVNPLQSEVGIIEVDNNREMEQMVNVDVCEEYDCALYSYYSFCQVCQETLEYANKFTLVGC